MHAMDGPTFAALHRKGAMHKRKRGIPKSGSGKTVKSRKQAIAIGLRAPEGQKSAKEKEKAAGLW